MEHTITTREEQLLAQINNNNGVILDIAERLLQSPKPGHEELEQMRAQLRAARQSLDAIQ